MEPEIKKEELTKEINLDPKGPDWSKIAGNIPKAEGLEEQEVVTTKEEVITKEEPAPTDYKYNPLWDRLAKEGVEIPDFVKTGKFEDGKDENEILLNHILNNVTYDDEFIDDYMTAKTQEGFNRDQWLQKYVPVKDDLLEMPNDKFLFQYYKTQAEKNQWTEDDINNYIGGLNKIQLAKEANELKGAYKQYLDGQKKIEYEKKQQEYQQQVQINQEKFNKNLEKIVANSENYTDIWGVKVDKSRLKEFNSRFNSYFIPDQSGQRPIDKIMTDENMHKILYLIDDGGALLKSTISEIKEKTKDSIENKLDLKEEIESKSPGIQIKGGPNWDRMAQPENY